MNSSFKVESGLQLLARLTHRPSLDCLWQSLKIENLQSGAVLEIAGPAAGGKSLLAANAVVNALLPSQHQGCGAGVIVFKTDGNFNFNWIVSNLHKKLSTSEHDPSKLEVLLNDVLRNLHVTDVYDSTQLNVTLEKLEFMLADNPNISLIVFDTLTAFYWSDQSTKLQKMDSYLKSLLRKIQKITKEHKVTTLYTKPQYFGTKQDGVEVSDPCAKEVTSEKVNCRIQVFTKDLSSENILFQVTINTSETTTSHSFRIVDNELVW